MSTMFEEIFRRITVLERETKEFKDFIKNKLESVEAQILEVETDKVGYLADEIARVDELIEVHDQSIEEISDLKDKTESNNDNIDNVQNKVIDLDSSYDELEDKVSSLENRISDLED